MLSRYESGADISHSYCRGGIRICCNVGKKIMNDMGFLPLIGDDVWLVRGGIANILSFDKVCGKFVTKWDYKNRVFIVRMLEGDVKFK